MLFKFPVVSSLKIIEEVSKVVSAEDITAESSAAINNPYAQTGNKFSAKLTMPLPAVFAEKIPNHVNKNEMGTRIKATSRILCDAIP